MGDILKFPRGHRQASITVRGDAKIVHLPSPRSHHVRIRPDFAWSSYAIERVGWTGEVLARWMARDHAEAIETAQGVAAVVRAPVYDLTSRGHAA
jgi:hypothetical protein